MSNNFNDQKEKLVSLSHEINLLRQQVNYLLRNGKALELLDLDVMMNRTHAIYDLLCSVSLPQEADDQDLDFDPEALAGLFGIEDEAEAADKADEPRPELGETSAVGQPEALEPVATTEPEAPAQPVEEAPAAPAEETPEPVEETPEPVEETPEPVEEVPEPVEEVPEPVEETPVLVEETSEPVEETPAAPADEKPLGDEFGFFFRFEEMPAETPAGLSPEAPEDVPVVVDDKIVHYVDEIPEDQIPERDLVGGDDLARDNLFDMPPMDDTGFEMAVGETLGESLINEDHSLAAKLQQNPVRDLKSVIGINDKFLFVNELFGGNMEKYNKSIDNLNDLKTLNGAMIYLNELKIELQWNSSNEAYRKLSDLVSRKFE